MKAESGLGNDFPVMDQWAGHLRGVEPELLEVSPRSSAPEPFGRAVTHLVNVLGLTVVRDVAHIFGPGLTLLYILSESHLAIHTWPEYGYLKFDLVTCRKVFERREIARALKEAFTPEILVLKHIEGPLFTRGGQFDGVPDN